MLPQFIRVVSGLTCLFPEITLYLVLITNWKGDNMEKNVEKKIVILTGNEAVYYSQNFFFQVTYTKMKKNGK